MGPGLQGIRLSDESMLASLPADVLGKCLDIWDSEKEQVWERPKQRGNLKLVCKRWSRIIEREDDAFAVLQDSRQLNRLLARFKAKSDRSLRLQRMVARFPRDDIPQFLAHISELLEMTVRGLMTAQASNNCSAAVQTQIEYLAILLFDETVELEEGRFDRFLASIEGLRSLRSLAILPSEYRSFRPIKSLPLGFFLTVLTQPELQRVDVYYLPGGRTLPSNPEDPSSSLRQVHTATAGLGRVAPQTGSPPPDARAIEKWLFTPEQLRRYTSFGIIDVEPFLNLIKEEPGIFSKLQSLRLDYADLPKLVEANASLPSLTSLHLDGLVEDHDFDALTHFDLDYVEFWHECDADTDKLKSGKDFNLKEQFDRDVLDSLRKLPDGPYPFRLFVLRCHRTCGPLNHLDEAASICKEHDAVFERRRGTDLGWAYA